MWWYNHESVSTYVRLCFYLNGNIIYFHCALLPLFVFWSEFELFIPLCSMETCGRCPSWAVSEKLNDANAVSPTLGTFFITTCRSLLRKSQAKELLLTHYGLRKGILRLAEKNLVQTSAYSLRKVCLHVLFFEMSVSHIEILFPRWILMNLLMLLPTCRRRNCLRPSGGLIWDCVRAMCVGHTVSELIEAIKMWELLSCLRGHSSTRFGFIIVMNHDHHVLLLLLLLLLLLHLHLHLHHHCLLHLYHHRRLCRYHHFLHHFHVYHIHDILHLYHHVLHHFHFYHHRILHLYHHVIHHIYSSLSSSSSSLLSSCLSSSSSLWSSSSSSLSSFSSSYSFLSSSSYIVLFIFIIIFFIIFIFIVIVFFIFVSFFSTHLTQSAQAIQGLSWLSCIQRLDRSKAVSGWY